MRKIIFSTLLTVLLGGGLLAANNNGQPTPGPIPSQLQPQLIVNVKDDVKNVHFINANNDPDVVTKVYIMKHADPEELRPYLRTAAMMNRVVPDTSKVECLKFNDGTGALVISAEDYRFMKPQNGMSFDEIIQQLDIPEFMSSSGTYTYLYFPKYTNSAWLSEKLVNVGFNVKNDPDELDAGKDKWFVDTGLNGLLIYVPYYSVKNINEMIQQYDVPISEIYVKYTIYELDTENDGALGVDFQAWKNGPGRDLFAVASRYGHGWDFANNVPNIGNMGASHTQFVQFSPKWNTKYLDFLVAKSKASIVTSGQLSLQNNQEGLVQSLNRIPNFQEGKDIPNYNMMSYMRVTDARVFPAGANPPINDNNGLSNNRYRFSGFDDHGEQISITWNDGTVGAAVPAAGFYRGDIVITKFNDGNRDIFTVEINEQEAQAQGARFVRLRDVRDAAGNTNNRENIGYKVSNLYGVVFERAGTTLVTADATAAGAPTTSTIYTYSWVPLSNWATDLGYTVYRDAERDTAINGYGFKLLMKPVVCGDAAMLNIEMENTSLIGYTSNGHPRTSKSEVSTKVMVGTRGNKFVIGGLEKKNVVRSVNKVPWLGDLPLVGWALSSESEVTKTSHLVAVLECVPVMPDSVLPQNVVDDVKELKDKLDKAGVRAGPIDQNDYGFDQYLFDSQKKGVDEAPYAY